MDKYPYIGKHHIGCIVLFLDHRKGICLNGVSHNILEERDDWNEDGFKKCIYYGIPTDKEIK